MRRFLIAAGLVIGLAASTSARIQTAQFIASACAEMPQMRIRTFVDYVRKHHEMFVGLSHLLASFSLR